MQPFTYLKLLQTCELIFQDGGLNWFENLNKSPWKLRFSQDSCIYFGPIGSVKISGLKY